MNYNVILVDDDGTVVTHTANIFKRFLDFTLVSSYSEVKSAIGQSSVFAPNLFLIDVEDDDNRKMLPAFADIFPNAIVIGIMSKWDADKAFESIRGGALGCIIKPFSGEDLIDAIKLFSRGIRNTKPRSCSFFSAKGRSTSFNAKLDLNLRRAGLPLLGSEYIVATVLSATFIALITLTLTLKFSWAGAAFFFAIVASAILLNRLIARRRERFINQLGNCLTTVANALRSGFSFVQAMDLVSKEMEPPISEEFGHVMRDLSYGMLLPESLDDMDKRVDIEDLHLVITAVLIQREIGGNLAQILDNISQTITERVRMRREISTLTIQGKVSALIVSLLPVFIAIFMLLIDPHHFDALLNSQLGIMILCAAVVLEIFGFIIIRKIVDIKFD